MNVRMVALASVFLALPLVANGQRPGPLPPDIVVEQDVVYAKAGGLDLLLDIAYHRPTTRKAGDRSYSWRRLAQRQQERSKRVELCQSRLRRRIDQLPTERRRTVSRRCP